MSNLVPVARKILSKSLGYLPTPTLGRMPARYQPHQPIINPYQEEKNLTHLGQRIITSLEDRWAIVGMTGSGKTTMAKKLLEHLRDAYPAARVYILDSKQAGDFDDVDGYRIKDEVAPDVLHTPGAVQIWQPPDDDLDQYDAWFKKILLHRQPAIIKVDESASIIAKNGDAPEYYRKLNKLGRAFGVCLISLTQEAAYIPRTLLGQATHVVRFRLLDGYDVKKIDKLVGRSKEDHGLDLPDPYGFIHRRVDKALPGHYYKNHQEFFGG